MRPTIAISAIPRTVTTGYGADIADTVTEVMVDGVLSAGAAPLMLPVTDPRTAVDQLRGVDGIILAGGPDLAREDDPGFADRRRDRYEFSLWRQASASGIPVLGICRGLQLVNVALGGTLRRHVAGHDGGSRHATLRHHVRIEPDSRLQRILGAGQEVNTLHHQSIDRVAMRLRVVACTADGCIEAAEIPSGEAWFIGVQWHPELMLAEPAGQALFDALVIVAADCRDAAQRPAGRPSPSAASPRSPMPREWDEAVGTLRNRRSSGTR